MSQDPVPATEANDRPRHRLPDSAWLAIACGCATPEVTRILFRSQHSRQILLALGLLSAQEPLSDDLRTALAVLSLAQKSRPEIVVDLFCRSWFGAWVSARLRGANDIERAGTTGQIASRLGAMAAIAAERADVDAEVRSSAAGGYIHLPGKGRVRTTADDGTSAKIEIRGATIVVHRPEGPVSVPEESRSDTGHWQGLRDLQAPDVTVGLDDIDPCRDCFGAAPASRLPADAYARWCERFTGAWWLLDTYLPALAAQLRAGVQLIAPLALDPTRGAASITSSQQLGAMAMTEPADAAAFATTLVHEWAHSALTGLMAFTPLHTPQAVGRFFVPWRLDPRPIRGALHGSFAFLAIAEAWAGLRESAALEPVASAEFTVHREQVSTVLDALSRSDGLTEHGVRLLGILQERCHSLLSLPAEPETVRYARRAVADARAAWLRRNGPVDVA